MNSDRDIKIAGDKPSVDVKKNRLKAENGTAVSNEEVLRAKKLGKLTALRFAEDAVDAEKNDTSDNGEMMLQRRLLLSFTATIGFEMYCGDDMLAGIAQKSFLDNLKRIDPQLYTTSSDTGAFSFYYLAFRRGGEVDRRIGQTFAMLCSHDGDPIFQELGEALYCWFLSEVRDLANEFDFKSA